jgi:hypothetical protein
MEFPPTPDFASESWYDCKHAVIARLVTNAEETAKSAVAAAANVE